MSTLHKKMLKTFCVLVSLSIIASIFVCASEVYYGPKNKNMDSERLYLDSKNKDFRGAIIDINMFEDSDIIGVNYENSNFEGCRFGKDNRFVGCSFRGANLRGVNIELLCGTDTQMIIKNNADMTDADISLSAIYMMPELLKQTRNYKEKNLANTTVYKCNDCDFSKFNLRGTYFDGDIGNVILKDADITKAIFKAVLKRPLNEYSQTDMEADPQAVSITLPQLYSTRNYKEKTLGSVIFIYLDLKDADFRGQTLGYFDCCNLEGADLTDAIFATSDERTLPPFSKNNPVGVTDCKITVEQFKQTLNYKIWQDRGIPKVEKILITDDNCPEYNYGDLKGRQFVLEHFDISHPNIVSRLKNKEEREKLPERLFGKTFKTFVTGEVYLYKVGGIFVTSEIAEFLEKERDVKL